MILPDNKLTNIQGPGDIVIRAFAMRAFAMRVSVIQTHDGLH